MNRRCVILYARAPRDEAAIKRMPRARVLFEHLRRRTLIIARGLPGITVLESSGQASDLPQHGVSFEERLLNVFRDARDRGFEQLIAIPIDVPEICEKDLLNAFVALGRTGAALGPSPDGGVYILGIQAALIDELRAIEWNSENVFVQLLERLPEAGILRSLDDIDTVDDLRRSLSLAIDPFTRAVLASLCCQQPAVDCVSTRTLFRAAVPRSGRAPPLAASL